MELTNIRDVNVAHLIGWKVVELIVNMYVYIFLQVHMSGMLLVMFAGHLQEHMNRNRSNHLFKILQRNYICHSIYLFFIIQR